MKTSTHKKVANQAIAEHWPGRAVKAATMAPGAMVHGAMDSAKMVGKGVAAFGRAVTKNIREAELNHAKVTGQVPGTPNYIPNQGKASRKQQPRP